MTVKNTLILAALSTLLLSGCANKAQKPAQVQAKAPTQAEAQKTAVKTKSHREQIASLNRWQAEGRIAASKGDKGNNASFTWQQRGSSYKIRLFGPFGAGSAYITGHPQYVELKEADGKTTRAKTPEELLQKVAHLQVPITGLCYWMKGSTHPNHPVTKENANAQGQLAYLEQEGWRIHYENYNQNGGLTLPSKMRLENGTVKVKMVINNWQAQ